MPAVLITGAAKGIGQACALRLAGAGHTVFAGVRKDTDAEVLAQRGGGRITALRLDVTNPDEITAAAAAIEAQVGTAGLAGLVNNAGIAVAGPLEFLPIDALRHQLEVNVVGQIAVTQAMLPLLRRATGRIVNISSISGRSALPMTSAYAASKHALEALTDGLRVELMPWHIQVALVEPGVIATPIWQTSIESAEHNLERLPPHALEYYGRIIVGLKKRVLDGAARRLPPDRVAKAVAHALFAKRPRTRYVVGRDARARLLLEMLPDRVRDHLIARKLRQL